MNIIKPVGRIPLLALSPLWLAYTLLGWYLSAHHIIWLVGAFIAFTTLVIIWKSSPLLAHLSNLSSQGLFVVISVSLIFSLLVALAITWSTSFAFMIMPFITTFFAQVEMSFNGFNKLQRLFFLTLTAGLGLIFREGIDLVILPSVRY